MGKGKEQEEKNGSCLCVYDFDKKKDSSEISNVLPRNNVLSFGLTVNSPGQMEK